MDGKLRIWCPAMGVNPTSSWNPLAPRLTDNLPCAGVLTLSNGERFDFGITFPPCYVRKARVRERMTLPDGTQVNPNWIVDEVTAFGTFASSKGSIAIEYGREAIVRRGENMAALPVDGFGSATLPDGRMLVIDCPLPEATGRPTGQWWQWWTGYVVDAVQLDGEVKLLASVTNGVHVHAVNSPV